MQTLKQNTEVKTASEAAAAGSGLSKPNSDVDEVTESTLSPGKRRLKKQVQKHRRKVSETQTENSAPLARLLPGGTSGAASTSTEAILLASSYAQTSPVASPRLAARRRSHRHYHSRPKFETEVDVDVLAGSLSSVTNPSSR